MITAVTKAQAQTVSPPSARRGEALLTADALSVVYQSSRGPQKAVDDMTLRIGMGEFVSILGPSGCGKSTFLNVVAGLLRASSGRAAIKGQPITGPRPDIGIVFQRPTLLPWATVLDNVLIPIQALRRNTASYRERAYELLELVGLRAYARHYPEELSGGMQQRVGIARALIHDPSLLLMDEPFAALDAMTRERMSLELQDIWNASRKTVLFITHSIPEAVFLSDRILVMTKSPGRIREEIAVDLPRPRTLDTMSTAGFAAQCGAIRNLFTEIAGHDS
jgi:NitT/TauT family transport system ATP-binding protein